MRVNVSKPVCGHLLSCMRRCCSPGLLANEFGQFFGRAGAAQAPDTYRARIRKQCRYPGQRSRTLARSSGKHLSFGVSVCQTRERASPSKTISFVRDVFLKSACYQLRFAESFLGALAQNQFAFNNPNFAPNLVKQSAPSMVKHVWTKRDDCDDPVDARRGIYGRSALCFSKGTCRNVKAALSGVKLHCSATARCETDADKQPFEGKATKMPWKNSGSP